MSRFIDEKEKLKIELLKYTQFWKQILLVSSLFVLFSYVYYRYSSPIYRTETKIKVIDDSKGFNLPTDPLSMLSSKSKINLDNEIEVLHSYRLLSPLVRDLNLCTQYFSTDRFNSKELWDLPIKITSLQTDTKIHSELQFKVLINPKRIDVYYNGTVQHFTINSTVLRLNNIPIQFEVDRNKLLNSNISEFLVKINSFPLVIDNLISKLKIEQVGKDSDIISLVLEDRNKTKTQVVLNEIVKRFNEDGISDSQLVSKRTVEFIDDRFKYLTKELDSIENAKKNYKQSRVLTFIDNDTGLNTENKSATDEAYFNILTQIELSNLLKETISKNNDFELLPSNIGLDNDVINGLVSNHNTQVLEREKLLKIAGKNNPNLQLLENKLIVIENNLKLTVSNFINQLKIKRNQIKANNDKFNSLFSSIPLNEKNLRSIERQQQIKENIYLLLLQKREESAISYVVTAPSIKVIDFAVTSNFPIKPKKQLILFTGFLIGFGGSLMFIYLYFLFDTKIKSNNDIKEYFVDPVIVGEIPYFENEKTFKDENDQSLMAESFRILYSNLKYLFSKNENSNNGKVFLVTSSILGEGKSFIASNLALAVGSYKHKVLLIGADLRRPRLSEYVNVNNVNNIKGGLSTYLSGYENHWKDLLVQNSNSSNQVDFLFSGPIPPNPSTLFSGDRFMQLLEEAKLEYDYIFIDSAPTIYINDTFLLSHLVDQTIYVTRYNYTDKKLLDFLNELILSQKLSNVSILLNSIEQNNTSTYNYGYGYGYGYNSYSDKKENSKKSLFFNKIKNIISK